MGDASEHDERLRSQRLDYEAIGFGHAAGKGTAPALLVIDMCSGITAQQESAMYIDMANEIANINSIASLMRGSGFPVVFLVPGYTAPHYKDAGRLLEKVPAVAAFDRESPAVAIDSRLEVSLADTVVEKQYPSAFFGTSLQSMLTSLGIDTVIVTGNSTSGCVRATVTDAVSAGFYVVIPKECVADRASLSHEVNLFDMNAKYADVVTVEDVAGYIADLSGGRD